MLKRTRFLNRFQAGFLIVAAGSALVACNEVDGFTPDQWDQIKKMEPLAGERPHNPYNNRDDDDTLAKLGQMLFFEKDVAEAIKVTGPSGNAGEIRKVACVTCHGTEYFTDAHPAPSRRASAGSPATPAT